MADNTSLINLPTGFDFKDYIGGGNSGIVLLDKHTLTVIKIRLDGDHSPEIDIERQIYERFIERGGQKGIPIFYGTFKHGIRLDHVAEALDFVHECGVIHGDVQGFNVLIDWRLDAKLADFAGSSLDGSPLLIATNESHTCPGRGLSRKGDIFALGSTIYELMTGCPPYAKLSDSVIRSHYSKGQYPDTKSLGAVGSIITKCWRGKYDGCKQVVDYLKAARNSILASLSHSDAGNSKYAPTYTSLLMATVLAAATSALVALKLSRGR